MSHMAFYWNSLSALTILGLALWIGNMFYYVFGLYPSLGLLDPTQKSSVLLQGLKRLSLFSSVSAFLTFTCQVILLIHFYLSHTINWLYYSTLCITLLMLILQFYGFTKAYQKVRRALRPKINMFSKINSLLKYNLILGILDLILMNF